MPFTTACITEFLLMLMKCLNSVFFLPRGKVLFISVFYNLLYFINTERIPWSSTTVPWISRRAHHSFFQIFIHLLLLFCSCFGLLGHFTISFFLKSADVLFCLDKVQRKFSSQINLMGLLQFLGQLTCKFLNPFPSGFCSAKLRQIWMSLFKMFRSSVTFEP